MADEWHGAQDSFSASERAARVALYATYQCVLRIALVADAPDTTAAEAAEYLPLMLGAAERITRMVTDGRATTGATTAATTLVWCDPSIVAAREPGNPDA
jgi:hypothetical protein